MKNRNDFELLLPVGQKEMAEAAIHNGADAIYIGFPGFNARGRSYDFELQELKEIIELCHLYGVKVNLAFNIVIFETELSKVIEAIYQVLPLKPDALIVQDLGLVRLIKQICPQQIVHASTQMTITNDLAMALVSDLQIRRYVLGRENSLHEIKLISQRTTSELEVFVHGALCVSYSGQCFTSETLGGRSANRGQCAQSCRFTYDLIVDGEKRNLLDRQYLVSPQDLCGINEIPELMELGVKSFKIEGRLKSPEYVGQVARSYRKVIDHKLSGQTLSKDEVSTEIQRMSVEYSRGFFPGWLHGVNHQELVEGAFSSHRGLEVGRILSVNKNKMSVEILKKGIALENGDGVSWYLGKEKNGAVIYSAQKTNHSLELEFSNQTILSDHLVNQKLYLNHDRSQKKDLDKAREDRNFQKKISLKIQVNLKHEKPLTFQIQDDRFNLNFKSESLLALATNAPLTREKLLNEFQSLTHTPFSLHEEDFVVNIPHSEKLFLNHKEIKKLRQESIQTLIKLRKSNKIEFPGELTLNQIQLGQHKDLAPQSAAPLKLHILLRKKSQVENLEQAILQGIIRLELIDRVTLDFEFGRDYSDSLKKLKDIGVVAGLATTRILKPQEYQNLKILHSLNPDFILVRNLGAIEYYKNILPFSGELIGDFSLNVTNHLSFEYLKDKGLSRICLSYDLNFEQAEALLAAVPGNCAEITVHQSMPSFHMEHCVFAAFLSKGRSFKDCGKPCEKHQVQLKDQFGNSHWIKPDQECRNTMYNASAQTALPFYQKLVQSGLQNFRFEALHEEGEDLILKIKTYLETLNGELTLEKGLQILKTKEAFGLSPRQLARSEEYRPQKKDHSFIQS